MSSGNTGWIDVPVMSPSKTVWTNVAVMSWGWTDVAVMFPGNRVWTDVAMTYCPALPIWSLSYLVACLSLCWTSSMTATFFYLVLHPSLAGPCLASAVDMGWPWIEANHQTIQEYNHDTDQHSHCWRCYLETSQSVCSYCSAVYWGVEISWWQGELGYIMPVDSTTLSCRSSPHPSQQAGCLPVACLFLTACCEAIQQLCPESRSGLTLSRTQQCSHCSEVSNGHGAHRLVIYSLSNSAWCDYFADEQPSLQIL